MDPSTITDNSFTGKTERLARPDRTDPIYQHLDEATLRRKQSQWDAAEAWRQANDDLKAQRFAAVDAKRAADAAERTTAADARFVAELRGKYLAADPTATAADFQRDLPEIRRQHRIAAATAAEPVRPLVVAGV